MRSAFSADGPSTMSQPVSSASAPRLAVLRRNRRRDGSGSSLRGVLDEEPGVDAWTRCGSAHRRLLQRPRIMARRLLGTSSAMTTWTTRNSDDRGHGEEMHQPRALVAAEQGRQLLQLHRLPDGEAGGDDDDAGQQHAGIEQPSARRCSGRGRRGAAGRSARRRASRTTSAGRIGSSLRRKRPVAKPEHQVDERRWRSAATWRRNARAGRRRASRPA